jgi:DNA-binding NarL/FixJ family response regulator
MIEREKFDEVLTDILMPIRDGLEIINHLRCHAPETSIVAMSGGGRRCAAHYLEWAKGLGAQAILLKPFSRSDLVSAISEVCAGKRNQHRGAAMLDRNTPPAV